MRTDDFDFALPPELIAQTPIEPRDASRLMVMDRVSGRIEHQHFADFVRFLRSGDLLVLNQSRVLRARLRGRLRGSGGVVELLLLRRIDEERWEAMARPGRRLPVGRVVELEDGLTATVEAVLEGGERVLRFSADPEGHGEMPLPPYIRAPLADPERYQTVYARETGSAAAPTAGLHFTPELLTAARAADVGVATLTLHIGPGTFRPVAVEDPAAHPMHAEWYEIDDAACDAINGTRAAGGRIVAVGTTAVRVLEQRARDAAGGPLLPGSGWTRLLLLPGDPFLMVDALVTNFHLPRSTLLMLVSAFAGRESTLAAYAEAVRFGYRFYSFGDAMLIL